MTNTSIRAELRTAAEQPNPWDSLSSGVAAEVVLAFNNIIEPWDRMKTSHDLSSWFFLFVAEAL